MKKALAIALSFCLLISSIFIAPVVQAETTYARYAWDFEDGSKPTGSDLKNNKSAANALTVTDDGALSLCVEATQSLKSAYISYYITVDGLKRNTKYHVSGSYKLANGTINLLNFGSYGGAKSGTNGASSSSNYKVINYNDTNAMTDFKAFSGTFTSNSASNDTDDPIYLIIGMYISDKNSTNAVELLVDDLVFTEVIDDGTGIVAETSDANKGTASVANANNKFTDIAKGETAVFTATPADGYELAYWKNAAGEKLYGNPYSMTAETDTTLTAYFQKYYPRLEYNFDTDPIYSDAFKNNSNTDEQSKSIIESGINGKSLELKITQNGTTQKRTLVPIAITGLNASKKYHVQVSYQITAGTVLTMRVGCYMNNLSSVTNVFGAGTATYASVFPSTTGTSVMSEPQTFYGSFTPTSVAYLYFIFESKAASTIVIDDLIVSEVIGDGIVAATANATMGSASVANANTAFTDIAKGETAVFTAEAETGYRFTHWENEDGESVGTNATYQTVVNTDTTYTAHFEKVAMSTLNFVTNGGDSVDPLEGEVGTLITLPTPTKTGYHFAGWYTDADCSIPFTEKYFPETEDTLYAKWFHGIRQDFENYKTSDYNPYNATLIEDDTLSFSGNKVIKFINNGTSNKIVRVIIPNNKDDRIDAIATYGDLVTISLKYRVVSGSATYYAHMAGSVTDSRLVNVGTASAANYVNPFVYSGNTLSAEEEAINTWQTTSQTYPIKTAETIQEEFGYDNAADAMKYAQLYITVAAGSEIYIDDIVLYRSVNIPISYETEAVRISPVNAKKLLTDAMVGDTVSFKAECDETVTPTITYDGETLTTDSNGYYSIEIKDDASLSVTSTGQTAAQSHAPGVGLNGEDLTTYNQEVYSSPIWEGDTVYHEAVMFAKGKLQNEGENGGDAIVDQTTKTLLYPVEDVISIRSANLKTWYVKGVDFDIVDGKLVWLEGGKIPLYDGYFTVDQSTSDATTDDALYTEGRVASTYTTSETNGLVIMNDSNHEKYTVYVTYRHSTEWAEGEGYQPIAPEAQGNDLSKLYAKLASGEDIDVMVFGASTATGCSSTGANMNYNLLNSLDKVQERSSGSGIKAPTFFEQATAGLVAKYGAGNQINYHNIALGGYTSAWALRDTNTDNISTDVDVEANGKTRLEDRVAALEAYYREQGTLGAEESLSPDLIFIKFAGNESSVDDVTYKTRIEQIITIFRETLGYTNASIILMSGKVNNQRTYLYNLTDNYIPPRKGDENFKNYQREQEAALVELASETENCIAIQNTTFWQNIVASKDGEDYLSNNINHANDFWAMATAQQIVATAAQTWLDTSYDSKAAIRAEGQGEGGIVSSGLRTYNRILVPSDVEIVEFGATAVRAEYLEKLLNHVGTSSFTLSLAKEYQGKGVGIGVSHRAEDAATITGNTPVATKMWDRDEDGAIIFTAYLTGIEPQNYADEYRVQAYAIDVDGNVYFGEASYISIFKVANAIDTAYSAGKQVPDIDESAFWYFVNETTFADYKKWCEDYDCVCGQLYDSKN